jgi:hypothetical protein
LQTSSRIAANSSSIRTVINFPFMRDIVTDPELGDGFIWQPSRDEIFRRIEGIGENLDLGIGNNSTARGD